MNRGSFFLLPSFFPRKFYIFCNWFIAKIILKSQEIFLWQQIKESSIKLLVAEKYKT